MMLPNLRAITALFFAAFLFNLVPQSIQAAEPLRDWTMLVFINGHNNLDSFGKADINEMEKVGSTEKMNVVVQWASLKNKATRRLLVKKDLDQTRVTSPIVEELPQVDMGDYRNLIDFVRWGHENYPAKHYFVTVWNHGTGWHPLYINSQRGTTSTWDISHDDITKNKITTLQLGEAMAEIAAIIGRRVDVYGSDACLMGMVEVAHQMKDSVEYFIGSEDLEPGAGWPYDQLLERLDALNEITAKDISVILPEVFADSYDDGSQGDEDVTLSSFDLREIDALTTALSNLRVILLQSEVKESIKLAVEASLKFAYRDYVDLGDFILNLRKRIPTANTVSFFNDVDSAMRRFVVANKASGAFERAHGLAIWLPTTNLEYSKNEKAYRDLSFDVASQWHLLLEGSL